MGRSTSWVNTKDTETVTAKGRNAGWGKGGGLAKKRGEDMMVPVAGRQGLDLVMFHLGHHGGWSWPRFLSFPFFFNFFFFFF